MRKVKLRMNDQLKYEEIKKCVDGNQSKEKHLLSLILQLDRLIN